MLQNPQPSGPLAGYTHNPASDKHCPEGLDTSHSLLKNPQPQSWQKGLDQAPNIPSFGVGGCPSLLSCYPRQGILKMAPASTTPPPPRASLPLAGTDAARRHLHLQRERKAAVPALPQPSPRATEITMAGTSPIILLTMQNRLQPLSPCGVGSVSHQAAEPRRELGWG